MAQNTKLTAKQTALLTAIGNRFFSFFDDGITEGSGIWADCISEEIAGNSTYLVSDNQRGAARVAATLAKKGLLTTYVDPDDGAWYELTAAGADMANDLADDDDEVEQPAEEEVVQEELDLIGETAPVEEAAAEFGTTEWTEGETEWTRHTFSDGSSTLKRRRSVSGAWRTDYWSAEYAGGKETLTTSRLCKAALAAGSVNLW